VITELSPGSSFVHGSGHGLPGGNPNPWSLHLSFVAENEGVITTRFTAHPGLQGYRGILHGGVIAALLDTAMTQCLFYHGVQALTGDLRVRFVKPVACTETLEIRAWIASSCPPLYELKSELGVAGATLARARARFMQRADLS